MKTYIWTLPIRLTHCLLAIGLILVYIPGEDDFLKLLVALGFFVGISLTFGVLCGIMESKYGRFRNFPIGFTEHLEKVQLP